MRFIERGTMEFFLKRFKTNIGDRGFSNYTACSQDAGVSSCGGKVTLAANVDSIRGDPSGKQGRAYREEIRKKIEKWQEPPPAKQPKPLTVPDSEPKKKRGGRRLRKMKERYAITDMRKLANSMQFGVTEESSLGDGLREGYGMLGQAGNGKLRVSVGQSKLAAKVAKKFKHKQYSSGGATSGLTSSLAFTPVQGIYLIDGVFMYFEVKEMLVLLSTRRDK